MIFSVYCRQFALVLYRYIRLELLTLCAIVIFFLYIHFGLDSSIGNWLHQVDLCISQNDLCKTVGMNYDYSLYGDNGTPICSSRLTTSDVSSLCFGNQDYQSCVNALNINEKDLKIMFSEISHEYFPMKWPILAISFLSIFFSIVSNMVTMPRREIGNYVFIIDNKKSKGFGRLLTGVVAVLLIVSSKQFIPIYSETCHPTQSHPHFCTQLETCHSNIRSVLSVDNIAIQKYSTILLIFIVLLIFSLVTSYWHKLLEHRREFPPAAPADAERTLLRQVHRSGARGIISRHWNLDVKAKENEEEECAICLGIMINPKLLNCIAPFSSRTHINSNNNNDADGDDKNNNGNNNGNGNDNSDGNTNTNDNNANTALSVETPTPTPLSISRPLPPQSKPLHLIPLSSSESSIYRHHSSQSQSQSQQSQRRSLDSIPSPPLHAPSSVGYGSSFGEQPVHPHPQEQSHEQSHEQPQQLQESRISLAVAAATAAALSEIQETVKPSSSLSKFYRQSYWRSYSSTSLDTKYTPEPVMKNEQTSHAMGIGIYNTSSIEKKNHYNKDNNDDDNDNDLSFLSSSATAASSMFYNSNNGSNHNNNSNNNGNGNNHSNNGNNHSNNGNNNGNGNGNGNNNQRMYQRDERLIDLNNVSNTTANVRNSNSNSRHSSQQQRYESNPSIISGQYQYHMNTDLSTHRSHNTTSTTTPTSITGIRGINDDNSYRNNNYAYENQSYNQNYSNINSNSTNTNTRYENIDNNNNNNNDNNSNNSNSNNNNNNNKTSHGNGNINNILNGNRKYLSKDNSTNSLGVCSSCDDSMDAFFAQEVTVFDMSCFEEKEEEEVKTGHNAIVSSTSTSIPSSILLSSQQRLQKQYSDRRHSKYGTSTMSDGNSTIDDNNSNTVRPIRDMRRCICGTKRPTGFYFSRTTSKSKSISNGLNANSATTSTTNANATATDGIDGILVDYSMEDMETGNSIGNSNGIGICGVLPLTAAGYAGTGMGMGVSGDCCCQTPHYHHQLTNISSRSEATPGTKSVSIIELSERSPINVNGISNNNATTNNINNEYLIHGPWQQQQQQQQQPQQQQQQQPQQQQQQQPQQQQQQQQQQHITVRTTAMTSMVMRSPPRNSERQTSIMSSSQSGSQSSLVSAGERDKDGDNDVRPLAQIPCGHMFHRDCILRWALDNDTCPVCRADLLNGNAADIVTTITQTTLI